MTTSVNGAPFPLARLVAAGRSSLRRTTTVDVRPDGTWQQGSRLTGRGRDLVTDDRGSAWTSATHELSARIDGLGSLRSEPGVVGTVPAELAGTTARRGFRRALAEYLDGSGDVGGLEAALLDELPGMQIISGYAQVHEHAGSRPASGERSPSVGVCTGWKADGTAAAATEGLLDLLADRPRAEDLVGRDENVWHRDPPAPRAGMRRRRLVEVTPGDPVTVYGYFRDTYCQPDGVETVIHEYEVTATIGGTPATVLSLQARPGALPLPDCPGAAAGVVQMQGVRLDDVEAEVRRRLTGPHGCTHLNDLLRTLRLVDPLTQTFRIARRARLGEAKETNP